MEINKEQLREALAIVKPGLANKEIIEQTTSFAFTKENVVTYNDEICISHPIPGLTIDGAILAEELYNFLAKVKTDVITIEKTDNEIKMKAGRSRTGFALSPEILLPLDEEISQYSKWKDLPDRFLESLKFTIPCASTDMSHPRLTCIHLNGTIVEASDNFRVLRWVLAAELPFETTLIPATSMKEVLKLKPNKVSQGDGWLHFKNENETVISCRVYDDKYADTDGLMNATYKGITFEFPEEAIEMLERAEVFTKSKITNEEAVDVIYKNGSIQFESANETAWFKERIKVPNAPETEFSFSITPYLLKDILKNNNVCTITQNVLLFTSYEWSYLSSLRH